MNRKFVRFRDAAFLLMFLLMGCDPAGTTQMNILGDLLNNGNGPTMSISQLLDSINTYNDRIKGFDIHFPLTGTDERPLEDKPYVNPATGSKMIFSMYTDETKSSQLSDGFKLILIAADNCTSGQWLYSKNTFFERFVCNDADFSYLWMNFSKFFV